MTIDMSHSSIKFICFEQPTGVTEYTKHNVATERPVFENVAVI
jgi:hypothetical protein